VIAPLQQVASGSTRSGDAVALGRLGGVGELGGAGPARLDGELDGIGCDPDPATAVPIAAMRGVGPETTLTDEVRQACPLERRQACRGRGGRREDARVRLQRCDLVHLPRRVAGTPDNRSRARTPEQKALERESERSQG
jgi:hypothetical protein